MGMLSHDRIWGAIDALAARNKLSVSGLAKQAGLDSTSFNKSKRRSSDGRLRWPSTESIAKVMDATDASLEEFMSLIGPVNANGGGGGNRTVPLIGFAQAGSGGYFDDSGFPAGHGWEEIPAPHVAGIASYALSIQGDSMLPLYRDGDLLIVDPDAAIRVGDRVVVKTTSGEVMAKTLQRKTGKTFEFSSMNTAHPDRTIAATDVEWVARIVWASQ